MFGSVKLILDNSEFIIKFENIIDYYPFLEFQCRFQIILDIQFYSSIWILGDSILRNSLITFNMDKKTISFAQNIDIYQNIVESAISSEKDGSIYTVFYLMLAVALLVIFFIIYKCATRTETPVELREARLLDEQEQVDYEMNKTNEQDIYGLKNLALEMNRKKSSYYDLRLKDDVLISQKDLHKYS